jgi:oligopeptide/dipeptide ABC transporter ATP-binding protein
MTTDHTKIELPQDSAEGCEEGHQEYLLSVRNLVKYFPIYKGLFSRKLGDVKAVDDISFDLGHTQTLGLVGESGCGKTTAGRTILRLLEPTSGEAIFNGTNIFETSSRELRALRREMQIIFQDPYSSLNPRMTVETIIGDALQVHGIAKGEEMRDRVKSLLSRVGLQPRYVSRYPHEFSGGQRQRIGIARALALNPKFIVCDEAVSALDVSIQAQVINLLEELQEEYQLSYLFIAHDLAVVRHLSDRIAVMYLGKIVEQSDCDTLFKRPAHPYTQALLSAIPIPNPRKKSQRIILEGDVPSPINPPSGCRFHTRCPAVFSRCKETLPQLTEVEPGHYVACHLYTDPEQAETPFIQQFAQVQKMLSPSSDSNTSSPTQEKNQATLSEEGSTPVLEDSTDTSSLHPEEDSTNN